MRTMENMPVCDLRNLHSVDAVKNIEMIRNVALLILPKDAPGEVLDAITAIPMKNIASTISLANDTTVAMVNGISEIDASNLNQDNDTVLVVNGLVVVTSLQEGQNLSLVVNGMAIVEESLKGRSDLEFLLVNGLKSFVPFKNYKLFPTEVEIDKDFLSYVKPGTAVIAGKEIRLAADVTVSALQDSQVSLVAGKNVLCGAEILSYVQVISTVGHKVSVIGNDGQDDKG